MILELCCSLYWLYNCTFCGAVAYDMYRENRNNSENEDTMELI